MDQAKRIGRESVTLDVTVSASKTYPGARFKVDLPKDLHIPNAGGEGRAPQEPSAKA